ncbi:MAG: hypothetical protein ACYC4K_01185 [Thiobacillus sp.]
MARAIAKLNETQEAPQNESQEARPNIHVLTKNFGGRLGGGHVFYEKGTEFDAESDSPLISALYRAGAAIETKE